MAAVCLACSSQPGGASPSVGDTTAACKSFDGVSTVQDDNPGDGESAGSSVAVMVKSPWPSRTARLRVMRSQRLAEIAVLACNQLGVKYGPEPEIEMSLYGPDLRELPLDNTLEAVCGNSNDSGCVIMEGLLRLHLLPYKVLWEQQWCGEAAQRQGDVQQQQPRGPGDGIAKPCSAAVDAQRQAATAACGSAPDGQIQGGTRTLATQPVSSASSAGPAPAQLDPLEEPDWLPLYWHLWMSDPEHTAGMPAAPPDGCPPVSFVHEAETPLSVSLDVFARWMGIPPLGQSSRQQAGLYTADAASSGAIALPSSVGGDGPAMPDVRWEPCQEVTTTAAARPQDADDCQRTQPPQTQTIRVQATQSKQQATHPAQQTQQAAEAQAQSGCGSWCRHMEWLRGGGTRMLRLLAAATSSSSMASSTASDGGSGGGSSLATSGGTSSAGSSSERGPRGSGNGSSNGDSSGKVASSLNASECAAPQGGSSCGGCSSRRNSGSGTHGEVASLQYMTPGVEGNTTAEGQSATGGDLPACLGLQLLWLNRQVSYDASPAELGMCDQSVVALLNLCDKPDCAACLMTRGSLCGDVALVERAMAAGGLGPVDDAQRPPGAHAADEAGVSGSGISTSNCGPSAVVGKASVPSGGAKAGSRPPMLMPLGMAAANGYEEVLKLLLERRVDDPNVCDKFGLPALWFAVEHAQPGCVRLLLQAGARAADWVFATSAVAAAGAQATAAGTAAAATEKAAAERASAAAAAGLPLAVASYMGLCHAVEVGDVRTVRELLCFGACPYTPDDSNGTPYHMAIERGDVEILQALLEGDPAFGELQRAQADIYRRLLHASQRVERSEVAGCPCVQCNYRVAIRAAASPETEELRAQLQLVALPAVMDAAPPEAAVGLMAAMKQHGALLDAHDADGYTALHLAVRAGNLAAIRWLLQNGADPLERDALGYMPLHLLAHYGCSAAPTPAATAAAAAVAAAAATGAGGPCLGAKAASGAVGGGSVAGGEAAGAADATAATAAVSASGAQLELAAARLLVEDARMPLGAKTTCFAYEADVRAEEKKLRAGALGAAASTRGGGRRGGAAATAAAKKRSRDPMLTVPLYGGHTAAQLALRYGRPLLLAYLLHRGASMDLSSATSRHCLEKALEAGHSAAARILLSYVQQGKPSTAPSASTAASGNGQEARRIASRALKRGTGGAAAGGGGGGGDGSSGKCSPRDRSSSPPGGSAGAAEATAAAGVAASSAGALGPAVPGPAALLNPVVHMRMGAAQPNGPMGPLVSVELQPMLAESNAWLVAEASGAESVTVEVAAGARAAGEQAAPQAAVPAAATAGAATETTDGGSALLLERRKARRTGVGFVMGSAMGVAKYGGGAAACTCGSGAPAAAGSVVDGHGGKAACIPAQLTPNQLPPTSQKHSLPATQSTMVAAPLPAPSATPPLPTPPAVLAVPAPITTPAPAPPPLMPALADVQRPAAVTASAPTTQASGHSTAVTPAAGAPNGGSGGKENSPDDTAGDDLGNEGSDEANGSKSSRRARRRAARREARKAAAAAVGAVPATTGDAVAAAPATSGVAAAARPEQLPQSGAATAAVPAASGRPKSLEAHQGAAVAPALAAAPSLPPCQALQPLTGLPGAAPAVSRLQKMSTLAPVSSAQVPAAAAPAAAPVCAEAGPLPNQPHVAAGAVPLGRPSPWDRRSLALSHQPTSGATAASVASIAAAPTSSTSAGGPKRSASGIVADATDAAAADTRLLKVALAVEAYGRTGAEALEDDDGGQWKVVTGHRNRRGQVHGIVGAAAPADGAAAPQQSIPAAALAGPAALAGAASVAAPAVGAPSSAIGRAAARTQGGSGGSSSGSRHCSPPRATHASGFAACAILGDAAADAASMPPLPGISAPAPSQAPSTSPTAAAGGNSSPAAAGQRTTGVKRVSSTTSASAAVDACGYIEVPRSLLYGKRGTSGQSPTAPTTGPSVAWSTTPLPPVMSLSPVAGVSTATLAAAPLQAGGRPTTTPGPVPSVQTASTPPGAAPVAQLAVTTASAWAVTPPTSAGCGGGGGAGGGAGQSFAAAVKGEGAPGHFPAAVPPLAQQPSATVSAPLGRAASTSSASGPATSGLVAAVAASAPASAAGTPRDRSAPYAAAPAPTTTSSAAVAAAAIAAAVPARGRNSKASVKAAAVNALGAPAGETAGRAGCALNSTANASGARAGAVATSASTGGMQPPLSASKLNPQAHEFVPVRAALSSGNSATSASRPAAGAAVHLSVPCVHVAPGGLSLAASAGGRPASASSAQPGPGLASASAPASKAPAGKAALGGSAAPVSAAAAAVPVLGGGLLSPSPVPDPRHGAAAHQPLSSPAPGGSLDGGQMPYVVYGSSAPVLASVHSWPRAATPPLGASPLPTHMQHLQAQAGVQPGQLQPPPASPVAQVMSWQAVQPIQVLSSPIRRLPDLPDLYRAMVSPYCSYMAHSPRPTSSAGAAAAAVAAAAASAAVSASAVAVAAAATAAAVAEAQAAAAAANVGQQSHQQQQQGEEVASDGSSGLSSPERRRQSSSSSYNPLAAPLPQLSMLPHGLFCGEQLIRPTCTRLWGLDPLQQLRATQTSLDATIAAAFGVPGYLTATQPLPESASASGAAACSYGSHDSGAAALYGLGSGVGDGGMGAMNLHGDSDTRYGGEGRDRLSSGGGAGGGMSSGIVRTLHSIFAEEDVEEERRLQRERERGGPTSLLREVGAAAPPAGPQPTAAGTTAAVAAGTTGAVAVVTTAGVVGADGPGAAIPFDSRSHGLSLTPQAKQHQPHQPSHQHNTPHHHPHKEAPGGIRQLHRQHPQLQVQQHLQRDGPIPSLRNGLPLGMPLSLNNDWRNAVVSLFTGARTHSAPVAAQPAVAAAALWWTAVRQAPEAQSYGDDAAPMAGTVAAANGGSGRLPRPPGFEHHNPHAGPRGSGSGVWPNKVQHMHRKGSEGGGGSGGSGGSGTGSGGGAGGKALSQSQGLLVMTQRVQVVGPLDADSMITACLQGRLVPNTEVCGTLAGLVGPPPLELFEPLGALITAVQSGGGCYMLVEGW